MKAGLANIALEGCALPTDGDTLPAQSIDVVRWAGLRHMPLARSEFMKRWQRYIAALVDHLEQQTAGDADAVVRFQQRTHEFIRSLLCNFEELDVLVGSSEHPDGPIGVLHYLDSDPLTPQIYFLLAGCTPAAAPATQTDRSSARRTLGPLDSALGLESIR